MENGPGPLVLEDGVIDVERMLVEHNDGGDVAVDSFMCFNDKLTENTIGLKEVSRNYGGTDHGFAENRKAILKREVLDVMPTEEAGYFRLQNDFCNLGDEYLLGVEFGESITNLDYSSGERLQTSVSDSLILASCSGTGSPWKSELFRMETPGCQCHQLNVVESQLDSISNGQHAYDKRSKSCTSCTLKDFDKFRDISSSFEEVLSDENDGSISTLPEALPEIERNDKFELTKKDVETQKFQERNALDCADTFRSQKRSRKPTQRYIDEFEDPISKFPKKGRGSSPSTLRVKDLGVKGTKKCRSSAVSLTVEETSVVAIQVPFAVVHKECPKSEVRDPVHDKYGGHSTTRPRESRTSLDNQMKNDESMPPFHQKRSHGYLVTHEKKRQDGVSVAYLRKRSGRIPASKRVDFTFPVTTKKKDEFVTTVDETKGDDFMTDKKRDDFKNDNKRDDFKKDKKRDEYGRDECYMMARRKNQDVFHASESLEEVSARRKHHILWTIAEVRKLLEGVSQYGVGRWSRIKKLLFSSSAHRTSVDLKDKWRNLLKASGILERSNGKRGKKRNAAWRPLPKSVICQVRELAAIYPYPKGRKSKISHKNQDSPDRSTDITLGDYRRILRNINSN